MAWHLGIWTLGGTRIGEVLNATGRRLSLPLSSVPTASFQIRLDNPMANEITSRGGDVLLTAYQGSTLRFTGELTTAEEVAGDKHTLQCNFAGPLWRLQHRLTGKVASPGYSAASVSRADVAISGILATCNSERDTGVRAGSTATLHPTSVGPWYYKPAAEAFSEMAALKLYPFEDISTGWVIVDNFGTNNGVLTGRAIESGGGQTWGSAGDADDDFVVAGGAAGRTPGNADLVFGSGRYAIAGTNTYGRVMAQVDFGHSVTSNTSSGVFCRAVTVNDLVMARHTQSIGSTTVAVYKRLSGSWTALGSVVMSETLAGDVKTMRLQVETDGSWFLWHFPQGGTAVFPMLSGQDDDLSSTGPLATGTTGFYDENTFGGVQDARNYDNFYVKVPTVAITLQGFEYELSPTEPTVDGSGVQIATLNVSARLGSDKPNVIFEYGTGNRSSKSYQRIIDRNSLLTQGYTLTDTDVRKSFDTQAIADRGLFEEVVPNDLGDAGLRQALADAHVIVRKQAKQTVTFAPSSTAPVFGTDYQVGDTVRARASVNGVSRFPGDTVTLRVYGVEVTIDDEGKEEVSPVLVEE